METIITLVSLALGLLLFLPAMWDVMKRQRSRRRENRS
jgi:flagellar biogenesis protein FliO